MACNLHNNKCDKINLQSQLPTITESEDKKYFSKRALKVSRYIEHKLKKEEPSEDKRKNNGANT